MRAPRVAGDILELYRVGAMATTYNTGAKTRLYSTGSGVEHVSSASAHGGCTVSGDVVWVCVCVFG